MYKFKIKAGSHNEDGKTYRKGDTIESGKELDKIFKNKFERIVAPVVVKVPTVKERAHKPEEEEPKTSNEKTDDPSNDMDVTSDYKMPKDLSGIKVMDIGGGWINVIDAEDGTIYNEKGIRPKAVNKFLIKLAKELT